MIQQFPVYAVLPCSDVERAKTWWREKLGAKPMHEDPGGAWYECAGGTMFLLTGSPNAGTAKNTAASFQVTGLEQVMEELRGNGLEFLEYDQGDFKTENGVLAMGPYKACWFQDSEGNTIEINEVAREG